MSRSKKDGRHGGGHKVHWYHDDCLIRYPYCIWDIGNCGGCRKFNICKKFGAYSLKKKDKNNRGKNFKKDLEEND